MRGINIVFLLLLTASVAAAYEFTEKDVIDSAVDNNPGVSAFLNRYKAASDMKLKSFFLPNPEAGIEFMEIPQDTLAPGQAGALAAEITQAVPFPAKFPFMTGESYSKAEAARYKHEFEKRRVSVRAYAAYASLYRVQESIKLMEESVSAFLQLSKIASLGYGRTSGYDESAEADIEYMLADDALKTLRQEFEVRSALIYSLTGGKVLIKPADTVREPEIPEVYRSFEALLEAAFLNAPELKEVYAEVKEAENIMAAAYLEYAPDLKIKFRKAFEPQTENYSLMFMAEIPLWFISNQAPVSLASSKLYEAAVKQHEAVKRDVEYEVKMHYEGLVSHARSMKLYEETVIPKAEKLFESAASLYRQKKGTFRDVVEAQKKTVRIKTEFLMHVEEYITHYRELLSCCAATFEEQTL